MKDVLKKLVVELLTWEAKMVLMRTRPFIIAVTGSVGKTSTKDAIFHLLSELGSARKSEKSFNSEIGLPLTVLGLSNAWSDPAGWIKNLLVGFMLVLFPGKYPKTLVLEVGADHPGDISRAMRWLRPNIAVVTRLPDRPVHVENFPSVEDVKREKSELVRALPADGAFIANFDDPAVLELRTLTKARMLTYGMKEGADIRATEIAVDYGEQGGRKIPSGMGFRIEYAESRFPTKLSGVLGTQPVYAVLAGLAVSVARGEDVSDCLSSVRTLETPPGRMRIIPGMNESTIIDDSYNSSPVALQAALETLHSTEANHRIAVLGDMLELGEFSDEEHWSAGREAGSFVDLLVTVGERGKLMAAAAKTSGIPAAKVQSFPDSHAAGEWLRSRLEPGDLILVKGSQGSGESMIRMERTVKAIMADQKSAEKLLVRQGEEWLRQYTK